MASDLKTRAVLAPTMLLLVGGIYWLDYTRAFGLAQGSLSAGLLAILGLVGLLEYVAMMREGGFHVARRPLLLCAAVLHGLAFPFAWHDIDRELYPIVGITMVLLVPVALNSLTKKGMHSGLEEQGATLLGFILVSWPLYFGQGICFRHLPSLLFVLLVCKGGDIGGYVFGRMFGKQDRKSVV